MATQSALEAAPKRLDPQAVFRAALFIQTAFRRWQVATPARLLGIESTVPSPALRVALTWKQRLCRPETVDVTAEAMAAVAVICGRNNGLTLGPIVACYNEYINKLPADDAIFALLRERFQEVAEDMDEAVLAQLEDAQRPSEARAIIEKGRSAWGAPEKSLIQNHVLFSSCQNRVEQLKKAMEGELTARLEFTTTKRSIEKLSKEIELEFHNCHTPLRARVLKAKQSHKARMELEVQSNYGWPPKGQPATLIRAARWFALELSGEHPAVEDFLRASLRELRKVERAAEQELAAIEESTDEKRQRLALWPPAPKLIQQGITEQLEEILDNATPTLEHYSEELALECPEVLKRFRGILKEAFVDRCLSDAHATAKQLRNSADTADQEEIKVHAAAQLYQLIEVLQGEGTNGMSLAIELGAEFEEELEEVKPLIALSRPDLLFVDPDLDDGWHRPPDFRTMDQPMDADFDYEGPGQDVTQRRAATPKTERSDISVSMKLHSVSLQADFDYEGPGQDVTQRRAATPKTERSDISVSMKLHSVSLQDAQTRSEVLLLERCAMIIAEECGIPRQWISHLQFKEDSKELIEGTDLTQGLDM